MITMRRLIGFCLVWLLLSGGVAMAQGGGRQQIESAKIGLITNRLNLTSDQAPGFWSVYNEYDDKRSDIRRKIRQLNGGQNLTDEKALSNIKEINELKQQLANLDEEYSKKFLKVISPKQLNELYNTERTFSKMLLEQLKN
ncbi:hypothetical protein BLX24_03340 [Arsenicibacter rosenii]|uniref:Sensor of ECF-type sigma factor n=2 Tax=Arsenicibacter rosenii TaxID=1750698 RepID=A0A1S2VQR9_9BACT|nr:hypothetical protein BLX24_03340 [Arsenicibacter rosenii]